MRKSSGKTSVVGSLLSRSWFASRKLPQRGHRSEAYAIGGIRKNLNRLPVPASGPPQRDL